MKTNKPKELETVTVATRITKPMLKGLRFILSTNAHINTADYLRDLIRRDLEERQIKIEENEASK
jgi:hypothetical protein